MLLFTACKCPEFNIQTWHTDSTKPSNGAGHYICASQRYTGLVYWVYLSIWTFSQYHTVLMSCTTLSRCPGFNHSIRTSSYYHSRRANVPSLTFKLDILTALKRPKVLGITLQLCIPTIHWPNVLGLPFHLDILIVPHRPNVLGLQVLLDILIVPHRPNVQGLPFHLDILTVSHRPNVLGYHTILMFWVYHSIWTFS